MFTASGYYDLATAYFANAYMLHHSGIDPARVTIRNYPAGHMMYLHQRFARAAVERHRGVHPGEVRRGFLLVWHLICKTE